MSNARPYKLRTAGGLKFSFKTLGAAVRLIRALANAGHRTTYKVLLRNDVILGGVISNGDAKPFDRTPVPGWAPGAPPSYGRVGRCIPIPVVPFTEPSS